MLATSDGRKDLLAMEEGYRESTASWSDVLRGLRDRGLAEAPLHADAGECLERDWEDFVTFYDLPQEHWVHLRTTNPIESVFSGVRLRTDAARRMRVRENALYLVFKLVTRLSTRWRCINAPNPLALLLRTRARSGGSR